MLAALLLLQAAPQTAIDAERAFNRAAQTQGQWTAFRAFMAPGATLFTPQPEKAATALPTRNPPVAVQWWPADSYVSCDGKVAVNTGPWVRPKSFGYFTTVWVKQPDGTWKWLVDGGDALAKPRALPGQPRVHAATCPRKPVVARGDRALDPTASSGQGSSPDASLHWRWSVQKNGDRVFETELWDGKRFKTVIHDVVAAEQ